MTDKESRAIEARIKKLFLHWLGVCGLSHWTITLTFCRDRSGADYDLAGSAWVDSQYMSAGVTFYTPTFADVTDVEYVVVHELAHILVAEAAEDKISFHVERTTTMVAQALLRAKGLTA